MSRSTIEQGSPEWHALRLGKVTASRIADIMRKGRSGDASATRERYMGELISERMTGNPTVGFKSPDMEWGNEVEEQARDAYAFYRNADLSPVVFVDHPTIEMSGASPDRLVGGDGLLEIKCPATHTHIATLLGAPIKTAYITQMQWQMACTGRQWCDCVSFDPRMPEQLKLWVKRVQRDPVRIAELESAVVEFLAEVSEKVQALEALMQREAA